MPITAAVLENKITGEDSSFQNAAKRTEDALRRLETLSASVHFCPICFIL